MKILLATGIYPPEIGGPATYAELINTEFNKKGIDTQALLFREVRKYPKVIRHLVYFFKIINYSKDREIIFTQDPISTGIPSVIAGKLLRKKVVIRVAGDYAWEQSTQRYGVREGIDEFQIKKYGLNTEFLRKLQAWSVRHADLVITPSYYFSRLVSGWNKKKVKVVTIYNGININFDYKKDSKYETPTIITAGRLVPWKGVDKLIESLVVLKNWNLIVAGDGPDKDRLLGIARKNNVLDRIRFLGQIDREKLFEEIHRSHIFALLSTFESFSFQIVEAMFVGVPVVTLNIGNLSEIITNNQTGILLEKTEDFVKIIRELENNSKHQTELVNKGKIRSNDFSIENTIKNLQSEFNKLVNT